MIVYADDVAILEFDNTATDSIYELPFVYKSKGPQKITYSLCKSCGAPVRLGEPICPWCKAPYIFEE